MLVSTLTNPQATSLRELRRSLYRFLRRTYRWFSNKRAIILWRSSKMIHTLQSEIYSETARKDDILSDQGSESRAGLKGEGEGLTTVF